MPSMSAIESAFCRSAPWNRFARVNVTPWALQGATLQGDVIELGSGGGAMAENILHSYPGIHRLTLTDFDGDMVEATAKRFAEHAHVSVEQADSTALPFADESFDFVLSFLMLHHVIDWEATIAEAKRVLRPGGVLVGYDLTKTMMAKVVHRLDGSPHRLISPSELTPRMNSVGFQRVQVRPSMAGHVMRFEAQRAAS